MSPIHLKFLYFFMLGSLLLLNAEDTKKARRKRQIPGLSLFGIVRFKNDPCVTSSGVAGTCYTDGECTQKGGITLGSCAGGFGNCCKFSIGCNGISSENCTYIQSNNPPAGECRHTICPVNDNICQFRLDFDSFNIAGPSTNDKGELPRNVVPFLGARLFPTGLADSFASRCLTDSFSIINSGGTNPAPICGVNHGQHMYIDQDESSNGCTNLNFQLGSNAIFTTIPSPRKWDIKVTQIGCDSPSKAPRGCTQYFFENTNTVQTFNYDGGQHLAFQRQSICVRRNQGQCRICWTAETPDSFDVTSVVAGNRNDRALRSNINLNLGYGFTDPEICCGGGGGIGGIPADFDCLQIPGAMRSSERINIPNSRICGRSLGLAAGNVMDFENPDAHATICSTRTPFLIQFISDGVELIENAPETRGFDRATGTSMAAAPNKGFRLIYKQDSLNCGPGIKFREDEGNVKAGRIAT